jgi:hypothetical protein
LVGTDTEIEENSVQGLGCDPTVCLGEIALTGLESVAVRFQTIMGGRQSFGVPVASVEKTIRRARLQNRRSVTTTAQSAIQVAAVSLGLE